MYLPYSDKTIPVQRRETGLLRYGISDKESSSYDSLADFCYKGGVFEARIPWQLLGFRDPSRKEIQGDFAETGELGGVFIDEIAIGLVTPDGDQGSAAFTWNNWEYAETEERLRESYYIIRNYLAEETDYNFVCIAEVWALRYKILQRPLSSCGQSKCFAPTANGNGLSEF